jgi:rubrerythrin
MVNLRGIHAFICRTCDHHFDAEGKTPPPCPECGAATRRDWKAGAKPLYHPTKGSGS